LIALDAERLSSFSPALARRLVRFFLAEVRGDLRRISFEDVESVRRLEREKSVSLPGGLILRREDKYILSAQIPRRPLSYQYDWDGRTDFEVKELGLGLAGKEIRMTPVLLKSFFRAKKSPGKEKRKRSGVIFDDGTRAYLDASKVRFPLVIRNRREGDRYQPLGAPGRKKLKEIMRVKGIAPRERDKHPVFLSDGEIVWVLGLPVAERFKVTSGTKRVLRLEISRRRPPGRFGNQSGARAV
jgi:tRNA(Ile)-lysidine synthase